MDTARIRTKAELIDAIDKKLAAFPGITFNYTQPAEDAVDEARDRPQELARREDLRPRPRRARGERADAIKRVLEKVPRHRRTSRSCRSSASRASRSTSIARRSRATV